MRPFVLAFLLCAAPRAFSAEAVKSDANQGTSPIEETPILVPSPIPVGFLIAWKPSIITVRVDSGKGSQFGSDKLQPARGLARYTSTLFGEKLLVRAEIEGGRLQTDTEFNTQLGSDGYDATLHLLGGTAVQILPGLIVIGSAGLLTRYQYGTHEQGGVPRIGVIGATSNAEFEYRLAPVLTFSAFVEGGITPFPYGADASLGDLSDASEFRLRMQLSLDISPKAAVDIGYDFTRWHASFARTTQLGNPNPDQALLISTKDYALTIGLRWKP